MKAAEKVEVKFTRSSVIVYKAMADLIGVHDEDVLFASVMHDVNGTGNLYGMNKIDLRGTYGHPVLIHKGNRQEKIDKPLSGGNAIMIHNFLMVRLDDDGSTAVRGRV